MFISRIYAAMDDYVLVAVPLFLFMAQFLERSGVTDDLFEALRYLMGPIPGGIALAVVVVSTIFAACTGIVGASVVSMGLLGMPVLMKYKYSKTERRCHYCRGVLGNPDSPQHYAGCHGQSKQCFCR
jgi:TRAP-type mannitol/chloroaromatic compound transport system permease large subunit